MLYTLVLSKINNTKKQYPVNIAVTTVIFWWELQLMQVSITTKTFTQYDVNC